MPIEQCTWRRLDRPDPAAPARAPTSAWRGRTSPPAAWWWPPGTVLRPAEVGVLAAIGCAQVPVRPRPRVAVSPPATNWWTPGQRPGPGQIRDANIHSLCAQVRAAGGLPVRWPRVEDRGRRWPRHPGRGPGRARTWCSPTAASPWATSISSRRSWRSMGAEQVFWRVAQKPGGPLGLWRLQGKLVFGLPGNPVAAMLMFEEYVRPALRRMMGYLQPPPAGAPGRSWTRPGKRSGDPARTEFLRVAPGPAAAGHGGGAHRAPGLRDPVEHDAGQRPGPHPGRPPELPAGGEVLLQLTRRAGGPLSPRLPPPLGPARAGGPAYRAHHGHGARAGRPGPGRRTRARCGLPSSPPCSAALLLAP